METNGLTHIKSTIDKVNVRMMERFEAEDKLPKCPGCGGVLNGSICGDCVQRKQYEGIQADIKRRLDISRLGGLKAYDKFTAEEYDNKEGLSACTGFPDINLYIHGPAGSGKTHLAVSLIRKHETGILFKPQEIFRKCRGLKDGEEEQAVINSFIKNPIMVIDDLGVEKKTEFSFSALYEILDGRDMNYMTGLIITSNLSISELGQKLGDDRIPSRIAGMCRIVELKGKDRRL